MREGWTETTLGELTASTRPICYGVLKPGPYVEGGIPLVRITDMDRSLLGPQGMHLISPELDNEFRRSRLSGNEVLLSIQGTVGRVARCAPELAGANISRTIAVIDCDERLLNELLALFLESLAVNKAFNSSGSTRDSLNISEIRLIKVPLPPIAEQRRIVDVVSSVDAYIDALQHQVDAARTARDAVLQEVSTELTSKYSLVELGAFAEITDCEHKTAPQATSDSFFGFSIGTRDIRNGNILYSQAKKVSEDTFEIWSKRRILKKSDLIFSREAPVGQIGYVDGSFPVCLGQRTVSISTNPEILQSRFLQYWLASPYVVNWILERSVGITVLHINVADIKRIPIPGGLSLSEQNDFACLLSSVDEVVQATERAVVEAKNLRSGLLSDLLSGEHEIPVSYDGLLGAA
jgi:type I restriction enzyme S subunit